MSDDDTGTPTIRLGLVTDPDYPHTISHYLQRVLPETLSGRGDGEWTVEIVRDPVTAGRHTSGEMLRTTRQQLEEHQWDRAVCVTDLPLRTSKRPVLADVDVANQVAVLSLPALGGLQPHRRAHQMLMSIVDDLDQRQRPAESGRYGLHSALTRLLAPISRRIPDHDEVDVRYSGTTGRGRLRLITGMVRSNQPWRLVGGLSSALAAALAAGAFGLASSTVWQLGDAIGAWRHVVAMLGSIAVLTGWLIVGHGLWERPAGPGRAGHEQRRLYNASTVLTLAIGVGCAYVVLYVIMLGAALFIVDAGILASTLGHSADFSRYLVLAWSATSMGLVAGALGSGLETDDAVRQAAYGYREERRREQQQRERDDERA